jgi:hypothetical protein
MICARVSAEQIAAATANPALLRGGFCSWSGSSSGGYGGTSYSSSTRVFFDGQGQFRVGSESSFSGNTGMAYNASPTSYGRYEITGRNVVLRFADGSTAQADIAMRQRDGRITELRHGNKVYGPALCD